MDDFKPQVYESPYNVAAEASPVSNVLAATPRYASSPVPTVPQLGERAQPNFWQSVSEALIAGGAGLQGKENPLPAIRASQRAEQGFNDQRQIEQFRMNMEAHREGRAVNAENRINTKLDKEQAAREKLRAIATSPPMKESQSTVDPATGQAAPGEKIVDIEQRNRLLAEAAVDLNSTAAIAALRGEGFTANQLSELTELPLNKAKILHGQSLDDQFRFIQELNKQKTKHTESVGPEREAEAQALGAANYASLTVEQKNAINEKIGSRFEQNQNRLTDQFAVQMGIQNRRADQSDERIRLQEEQQRRLLPSQQKVLTGNKQAIRTINDFEDAFDAFITESKGATLSDVFRGTVAKNRSAQRAQDLLTASGRTPAERKLAAGYNAMIGSIKSLTDEVGVLTDRDIPRIMGSFDLAQDRKQVKANLAARRRIHENVINSALEDYQAIGKDVSGFKAPSPRATGKTSGQAPAPGTVQNGYRFRGGNPSDKANWEKQ